MPAKFLKVLCLVLLFCSCKKKAPEPVVIPPPTYGDTGIKYSAQAICDYNHSEAALLASGWTKSFEDNFDGNLSNWNIWNSGAYNNELQYYQAANLQVASGSLAIIAKKETVTGQATPTDKSEKTFKFTSGRIESKALFSASTATPKVRIAARIKLPKGYGMYPSFLSYGANWPTNGQIDLLVAYGQDPTSYATNYYYGTQPVTNAVRAAFGYITTDADLTNCYHVYETEWTKNSLVYYLDGKVVETKTSGGYIPELFGKKQNLSLALAVSSDFFTRVRIQTGTMYVDWVKVFTSK